MRNSNVIDVAFLPSATTGTYTLFNFFSDSGTALTASGINSGLSVNFLNGTGIGTLDYSVTGKINLVVTTIPEPTTCLLMAGAGALLMVGRSKRR